MTEPHPHNDRAARRITLITSPGCHFCVDAHTVLATLADQGRINLTTIDAETPEGESLVGVHRPALFPLVLLDGDVFSAGRLPRRKLAATLGLAKSAI
ncbi:MAG: glutaredoxin family protein [Propionibacteriaceae bacterium]|nr:glutaredoxin family protein [Propionibacteriaceae bacterium]